MERDADRVVYCKNVLLRNFIKLCDRRIAQGHKNAGVGVRVKKGVVPDSHLFDGSADICAGVLTEREVLDTVRGQYDHVDHTKDHGIMDITCTFNESSVKAEAETKTETKTYNVIYTEPRVGYSAGTLLLCVAGTMLLLS